MKIRFHAPRGVGPAGEGFSLDLTMEAAPRVGDTVSLGENERTYRVHGVHWYPQQLGAYVYIVLRD